MTITFSINYRTHWGESLYISGSHPALGGADQAKAVEMKMSGNDSWELTLTLPDDTKEFTYSYLVKENGHVSRTEFGDPHRFVPGKSISLYSIMDHWQDLPSDYPYFSSALTQGILRRACPDEPLRSQPGTVRFTVWAPMVFPDEILALAGGCDALGNWDPAQALRFNDSEYPLWTLNVPMQDLTLPFEYKFVVLKKSSSRPTAWEDRPNRVFSLPLPAPGAQIVMSRLCFANPSHDWKAAGTAIPVFSLRSEEDLGCGDFYDLKKMVDWCVATGQKFLQTLPINDTTKTKTWIDSYPYSANSSFALHPMFIRPRAVATLKKGADRIRFQKRAAELNQLPQVDYEAVCALKEEYMRQLYAEYGKRHLESPEFKEFYSRNEEWLMPYAAWRALRDRYDTPDDSRWEEFAIYDEERVRRFCADNAEEVGYFYFEQYHLDRQLAEVRDYAHQQGVVLKGDVPIGVGRNSADAWKSPRLFNMDCQAGAPPDAFSVMGQNWGFPTYNWEEMSRDGFAWWKARFGKMAEYFDAYRIDHILGFFRIWQIPCEALHGLLGYFNPALPYSPEELRNNYDFWIDVDLQTNPLIFEWMLGDFFGEYAEEAKQLFLEPYYGEGRYRLKEFVNTQRKVGEYFAGKEMDEKQKRFFDALLGLIDDVLFIEDPYQKGHYHPRITAQFTYQYRILSDYAKYTFDRLYNDFFYRRHNDFWRGKALWKLPPLIFSTKMLTCAEDLGMIPDCVPDVMHRLQILSLEIQRMPKDPRSLFGNPAHYPYYSVCTTSTHDMPGIRAWWEEDRGLSQRFYNEVLHQPGEAPYYAEPWICEKIVRQHLDSPSMLCILPLQDWLSTSGLLRREDPRDEQINVPANPHHYWRYRMHLTLEHLLASTEFNSTLRGEITSSGR